MNFLYLIGLLVGIAGMTVIDYQYKLALWADAHRTILTIVASVGIFIVWDILGIHLGIFFHGGSVYTLPVRIFPEFPIEEIFFLILLCYCTLVMYNGGRKIWRRT